MKKFVLIICCLLSFQVVAYFPKRVPSTFYVTEHWLSLTTSFDISTDTEKLGTVYRKLLSFRLTYELTNVDDEVVASAQRRIFSLTSFFDIYDENHKLIGLADEMFFSFFPSFNIYNANSRNPVATANMNFWNTCFTVTDPLTGLEMATISRPFFRLKNNWTIQITNRDLFESKRIDSRLLIIIAAFQSDNENWQQNALDNTPLRAPKNKDELVQMANQLEAEFNTVMHPENLTEEEHRLQFIDFCKQKAVSPNLNIQQRKAVNWLLKHGIHSPPPPP